MTQTLERLARRCARHHKGVILGWISLAVGLTALVFVLDIEPRSELRVPGTDSQEAIDLLDERFPAFSGITAQLVFHDPEGIAVHEQRIAATLGTVEALDRVVLVTDPSEATSADATTSIVTVRYRQGQADLPAATYDDLVETVSPSAGDGLVIEVGGALGFFEQTNGGGAERIGFVAAVIILLIAFGSLIAMGMPLLAALVGLGVGLALVKLVALAVDIPDSALTLASMIGIGVGIDYALFIVTRYRELRGRYRLDSNALGASARTAGKAVVFAGGTVVVSILGLAVSGIPFVVWMGLAAALMVLVMVLVSITLIPALLGASGGAIDRFELPWARRRRRRASASGQARASGWARWSRHVSNHPLPYLLIGVCVLVALSLPLFAMRLGQSDAGNLPESSSHRRAYDLVAERFGEGFNGPLLIAVDLQAGGALTDVVFDAKRIASRGDVVAVTDPILNTARDTSIYTVVPATAPEAEATEVLVGDLRSSVFPSGVETTGASAHVAGSTANFIDLADQVSARLPWVIGAIIAASFVLLVVMFRSLLVPLKAALLNLLSIGAAYGVIVAIFQWGWGKGLVGLDDTVPITSVIPMFMFAVLFGLSMDYEVFLLSRVREEFDRTGDNTASVVHGVAATGRIITSAALIMVSVFFGFVLSDDPLVKMAGVGLGTAILVDATIVRAVLVPSTMRLLGPANWWLPGWLERRLPRLQPA